MAIEVRIPTILRTYTDGAKSVEASGATPDRAHRRPRRQPPRPQGSPRRQRRDLRRFVNVYVNDEDVRFIGGLEAELTDGDQVVVLPAVAGGPDRRR